MRLPLTDGEKIALIPAAAGTVWLIAKRWWESRDLARAEALKERDRERDEGIRKQDRLETRINTLDAIVEGLKSQVDLLRHNLIQADELNTQLKFKLEVVTHERDEALANGNLCRDRILELEATCNELRHQIQTEVVMAREAERVADREIDARAPL